MNNEFLGDDAGVFFDGEYHPGMMNQVPFQPGDASMFVQPQGYFNDLTINPDDTSTFVQPQGYFNHITVNEMSRQDELVTTSSMADLPVYAMTSNTIGQQEPMPLSNGVMDDSMSAGYETIGFNPDPFNANFAPGLEFSQPLTDNAAAATNSFFGNPTAGPVELGHQYAQQEVAKNALQQEIVSIANENEQLRTQLAAKTKESNTNAKGFNSIFNYLKDRVNPAFREYKHRAQHFGVANSQLLALLRDSDTVPRQSVAGVCHKLNDTKRQLAQKTQECEFWKAQAQQLSTSSQPPLGPKATGSQTPARRVRKSPARRNQKSMSTAPSNVPTTTFQQAPHFVEPYTQTYEVQPPGIAGPPRISELHSPIDLTIDEPESSGHSPGNSNATLNSQATAETNATSCSPIDESAAVLHNSEQVPSKSTS